VLALVFLSVFGVWIAATLSFSESATKVAEGVRAQRGVVYAADGAVEQAIQRIRADANLGKENDSTCGTTVTLNGKTVNVSCLGQPGSGVTHLGGDAPKLGIITLADDPEPGVQLASNAVVRVDGGVYSHSSITFEGSNNRLNACPPLFPSTHDGCTAYGGSTGTVTALGKVCDESRIIVPALHPNCPYGTPDISGNDPGLKPAAPAFDPAPDPKPSWTCPPGNGTKVIEFSPGLYTDADKLNKLTDLNKGGCTKRVLWFAPGNYYFNFGAGSSKWTIFDKNVTVIGGVKTPNWDTTEPLDPSDRVAFPVPGECVSNPDADHSGVQFIFGGESRLEILAGRMELCAARAGLAQQVAVFGVKDATGTSLAAETGCITAKTYPNDAAAIPWPTTTTVPPTTTTVPPTTKPMPPTTTTTKKNNKPTTTTSSTTTTSTSTTTTTTVPPLVPCALVNASGDQSVLVINGTVYAPGAAVDISLSNIGYQVISRGIIARVFRVNLTPSSDYSGSLIRSPGLGSTTTADRTVLLRACVSAACDATGSTDNLRAMVTFPDNGSTPLIESWTIVRR